MCPGSHAASMPEERPVARTPPLIPHEAQQIEDVLTSTFIDHVTLVGLYGSDGRAQVKSRRYTVADAEPGLRRADSMATIDAFRKCPNERQALRAFRSQQPLRRTRSWWSVGFRGSSRGVLEVSAPGRSLRCRHPSYSDRAVHRKAR